jgi:hypothetical protein
MPQPVYVIFDGADITVLESSGDSFLLATDGSARAIHGLDDTGYPDGTEVKFMNNGPENVTLKHASGSVAAGQKFFLPGAADKVLGATGKPYWLVHNSEGPLGHGWYDGEDPA